MVRQVHGPAATQATVKLLTSLKLKLESTNFVHGEQRTTPIFINVTTRRVDRTKLPTLN